MIARLCVEMLRAFFTDQISDLHLKQFITKYPSVLVRGLFTLSAVLLPVSNSYAVFDVFNPYVYSEAHNYSNYYKDSSDGKSQTVLYLGAGLSADLKLSRQHFILDVSIDQAKHNSFSELDYIQIDARGAWNWLVGNRWSGKLGYDYNRKSSSFENRKLSSSSESVVQQKDMRTSHATFLAAGYQLLPDWLLKGEVSYENTSYQQQKHLERDTTSQQFDVLYQNTLNTQVGLRVRFAKNDLPDRVYDYDERELSALFYWQGSEKSALSANIGFTDAKYREQDEGDFRGTTGRLTYHWKLTGKTHLDISAWKETSSLDSEVDGYVLTKGLSISPTLSVSEKITVFGEISKSDDVLEIAVGQSEKFNTFLYRIGASWSPLDYLQMSFSHEGESRNSNIDTSDYDSKQMSASIQLAF